MKLFFHQLQLYDSGVAILHQGSHGHCYFSIVHAVTSQNILGSFMFFFQIENCRAVIQKMALKHHACHVEAIFQATPATPGLFRNDSHHMNSHKINTSKIRSRIPFANLQTYCTVDTKGCIQTGSNFGTQKTRHFWRPIRVPPRYLHNVARAIKALEQKKICRTFR